MELKINITTSDSCKVIIQDQSEYLPESFIGTVKNKFRYSDTVSIDVLQHNKVKETVYRDPTYTTHEDNELVQIPVKFDGWFTVNHIVLPSVKWFESERLKPEGSALGLYDIVYFSDGEHIYKYINNEVKQTTIDEVLKVNSINTTISKTDKDYVSICFLRKCYINLCKQIFNDRGFSSCQNKNTVDSELVYKRDLAWMAINVIKYLTECEQLSEVERIIETLQGCNGLCTPSNVTSNTNGCGCSK